jgi:hypothetical protein
MSEKYDISKLEERLASFEKGIRVAGKRGAGMTEIERKNEKNSNQKKLLHQKKRLSQSTSKVPVVSNISDTDVSGNSNFCEKEQSYSHQNNYPQQHKSSFSSSSSSSSSSSPTIYDRAKYRMEKSKAWRIKQLKNRERVEKEKFEENAKLVRRRKDKTLRTANRLLHINLQHKKSDTSMYEKSIRAILKKEERIQKNRAEKEKQEMNTLNFNKFHKGKTFHTKRFSKNQQIWLDKKEKKCEEARREQAEGCENCSFEPNLCISASAKKKRTLLAKRSRNRAMNRKAEEMKRRCSKEKFDRNLHQPKPQKHKIGRKKGRSRYELISGSTGLSKVPNSPPKSTMISNDKPSFVKSIHENKSVNISKLLVSAENLFLEANLIFKKCKLHSDILHKSSKSLGVYDKAVKFNSLSSARKLQMSSWEFI